MLHAASKTIALVFLSILVACGGGEGDAGDGNTGGIDGGGGDFDTGSATLSIGEQTWEFDTFGCAFGHAATESDLYSFSSSTFGEHTNGNRVQMQLDIEDDTGQGRYEGEGVIYLVYIKDIDDFQNPSVSFESTNFENTVLAEMGLSAPSGETAATIEGNAISATGLFDDLLSEGDFTQTAGTLVATCGDQSRR